MVQEFGKLVRDKIPQVIRANDEVPTIHVAEDEEYSDRLVEKLDEEVAEYRESRDVEELVDILEVIHAIRKERGVTVDELREMRARKGKRQGRFDEGIVLERVDK
jgi:predicted house-cleaning noncanonical NTP pyrophosphatase (MazG superfamily)